MYGYFLYSILGNKWDRTLCDMSYENIQIDQN